MAGDDRIPGEDLAEAPGGAPPGRKPFWTITTCCGCLALLALMVVGGCGLVLWSYATQYLTKEPYPVERVAYTDDRADAVRERLARESDAGPVEFSAEEFSILIQSWLDDLPGDLDHRFRADATPEGELRLQVVLQIPNGWFPLAGRYFCLDLTGTGSIRDGKPTRLRFSKWRVGAMDESEPVSEEDSMRVWDQLELQLRSNDDFRRSFENIKSLEFENGKFRFEAMPDPGAAPAELPEKR